MLHTISIKKKHAWDRTAKKGISLSLNQVNKNFQTRDLLKKERKKSVISKTSHILSMGPPFFSS